MASSMMLSSASAVNRAASPASSTANGQKSTSAFPITTHKSASKMSKNVGKIKCMKVWQPYKNKKFETLSYLPPLSDDALLKEVDYLLRKGWVPCLEFDETGWVHRAHGNMPGYYDGRYWTMWKLPMFGCTDSVQVLKELEECKKEYPNCFIRIIGFDNVRQTQCVSFIAYKPAGN